jgi:hypothetical protein
MCTPNISFKEKFGARARVKFDPLNLTDATRGLRELSWGWAAGLRIFEPSKAGQLIINAIRDEIGDRYIEKALKREMKRGGKAEGMRIVDSSR